jgi:hypothetical protein
MTCRHPTPSRSTEFTNFIRYETEIKFNICKEDAIKDRATSTMEDLTVRPTFALDSRFDKQALHAADDRQFSALMAEVDETLKGKNVPITSRPLQAIPIICKKGGFSLALGEPLAERIKVWFDAQYGKRIKVDLSLGYGPVVIQGDLYKMRSPWLFAGGQIVCLAGRVKPSGALPIVNVLDFVDGLTDQRANDLKTSELQALQHEFMQRQTLFLDIQRVQNDNAFNVALGDLKNAVAPLFHESPQIGAARWACLQVVEKFLKEWIRKHETTDNFEKKKFTHSLVELNNWATSLKLARVSDDDLKVVQCDARVRYGEISVSIVEIVDAFNAGLRCCAFIANEVNRNDAGSQQEART